MTFQHLSANKKLALSLAITTALSASFSVANAAEQTNQVEENIEVISVTGTRRSLRSIAQSTVPVDIISSDDMASTGQLEISQVLANQVPSFNYPSATLSDGTDHARPAVLRGLAPDHTLVLINGKRRHSGALLNLGGTVGRGSTAVDLNMIPTSAIKRVEVLRDGAAAQYGSDAIAGVINIVLKDATEGGSVSVTYGQYDSQMAGVPQLNSTYADENGNLAFNLGDDRQVNDGNTRTISANSGFSLADNGFLNVSIEYRDNDSTQRSGFDPREQYNRLDNGSLDPREFTINRYNHRFGKAELEDYALFYNMGYDLDNGFNVYSFGSYSEREGNSGGFYRRAKDSRNVLELYPNGFLPQIATDVKDYSLAFGLQGESGDWAWDVSTNYGRNDFGLGVVNSLNTSLGTNSQTEFDNGAMVYDQFLVNFDANTTVDFGLPDDVFFTIGAEYRRESYKIEQGEEASYITALDNNGNPIAAGGAQVLPGFGPQSATNESRHNVAVFAEFDTYLTDKWNVVLASRYEDYSDFGNTFTSKLATRYSITDNLSLRGAASTGFRAPSLAQSSYRQISTILENNQPFEVGLFPSSAPAAQALGAKQLDAEDSVNVTAGFVYTQGNFSLTVDAYRIDIDDRIVLSENLSGNAVQQILASAGELNTESVRYFTNAIDSRTQGVDIVATYTLDLNTLGDLRLNAAANINDTEITHVDANPSELSSLGDEYVVFARREVGRFEQGTPDNKLNLSAVWSFNQWQTTLRATRYGEVADISTTSDGDEYLDAKWITDLEVAYRPNDAWKFAVGANNLFDQYPQATVDNIGYSNFGQIFPYTPYTPYSLDGRFLYGNITYSF
ncbi:ligand-gated channel [Pseudoalteromonas haloplanktis]|uniref:TonB-dependent receptor plug domain-containing protein n=1 Tax=Pseudoalteromonas undina TaxID=43660 RepID=UPI0006BAF3F6|nr:TonB-dependent receptor [Pseudoalteromonas undina]KPH89668.1 ligand-gated channel [Pseudoalteromonas undina]OLF72099.1 ligand-gated channel [Pseudoalteromonas haloplanktis]